MYAFMKTYYCVPSAISIISGKSYDECESDIKTHLGDIPIRGVYLPIAVNILQSYGIALIEHGKHFSLPKFKNTKGTFLCEVLGHALVIKDGRMYDNNHPDGTFEMPRSKVVRCFEVMPEARKIKC